MRELDAKVGFSKGISLKLEVFKAMAKKVKDAIQGTYRIFEAKDKSLSFGACENKLWMRC